MEIQVVQVDLGAAERMEELLVLEMLEAIPRMKETLVVQVDVMAAEVVVMAQ